MHSPFTSSPGKIIIINGPSSSGKTTLALALQKQLDIPFIRFSFDLFMEHKVFPSEQIQNGTFSWDEMRLRFSGAFINVSLRLRGLGITSSLITLLKPKNGYIISFP